MIANLVWSAYVAAAAALTAVLFGRVRWQPDPGALNGRSGLVIYQPEFRG